MSVALQCDLKFSEGIASLACPEWLAAIFAQRAETLPDAQSAADRRTDVQAASKSSQET